jgi:hypothetical protein
MTAAPRIAAPLAASLALSALLAGCGGREEAKANEQLSAEGQAEPGKVRLKGSGVDISLVVPKAIRGDVKVDRNGKILYPGSTLQGMAMVGSDPKGKNGGESETEVGFATADAPDKVLAWYRDPARTQVFRVIAVRKEPEGTTVFASQPDGHAIKVHIVPRPGGGTNGRLVIHHSD